MPPKLHKAVLGVALVAFLVCVGLTEQSLVRDREALGLTRYTELKGAPPVLALTTVALGGFRGLISNVLWIRANDLQDQEKFFEMVQLADWITKLEPNFTQVWIQQSWNMAYNISVKFTDPADRWRWVKRGIELLRDQGMQYNPNDVLMYRELAWFFQHKMGQNLDDAHLYYKYMWASEMSAILGNGTPKWDELINPQTPDQKKRAELLTQKYKLDPKLMKQVDERYGPLEWRLPDAHAIYWAALGLQKAENDKRFVDPKDIITLRRVIYQSMQLSFQRGRITRFADKDLELGPNLDMVPSVSASYEEQMAEDDKNEGGKNHDHIETAHRNFLRDAVFLLYVHNREADAIKWFKYLAKNYPNKPILDGDPNSLPSRISLDDYAIGCINESIKDLGKDKTEAVLQGLEKQAYVSLVMDEDDKYLGFTRLCEKVYANYENKIGKMAQTQGRLPINFAEVKERALNDLLTQLKPEAAAILRTKLNLPAKGNVHLTPADTTLSVLKPTDESTNAPAK